MDSIMKRIDNNLIKELTKKLEEIKNDFIGNDTYVVGGVLENRFLFDRLVEIIKNNPKIDKPNIFLDYIKINYVTAVIIAICRQIDRYNNSVSLINFLYEVYNNSEKITKKWFSSQYKIIGISHGNSEFQEN